MITVYLMAVAMAASAPTPPARVEVPIRAVILSDGTRRYGVPLTIGARAVEAGLDTGSTGLRVVPGALAETDATPTTRAITYSYSAGAKLDGVLAHAPLGFGALTGTAPLQLVRKVGCTAEKPRCEAGRIPVEQFGIQGRGLPGEGFKAILGLNTAPDAVDNPLTALGVTRWIVELPRPGEASGRLVLNPTDEEAAGFVSVPMIAALADLKRGLHDAVNGCLANEATSARICGAVMLDTGAPGIRVADRAAPGLAWPDGTRASLLFGDAAGKVRASAQIVTGRREQASHLDFEREDGPVKTRIFAGLTPYFGFSVLYDATHGLVGFRPRPPLAGGVQAAVAAQS